MKKFLLLAVLFTSVTGYSRMRCDISCEGDQRSPFNFTQVNAAKDSLLQTAQNFSDRGRAASVLLSSSGKNSLADLTTAEFYAHSALTGRTAIFNDLMDCSCPIDYSNLINLLRASDSVLKEVKAKTTEK